MEVWCPSGKRAGIWLENSGIVVIVFRDSWEGNLTLTVPHPLPPPQGFN